MTNERRTNDQPTTPTAQLAEAASSAKRRPPLWFIFSVTISGVLANTLIAPNIPDILDEFGQPDNRAGILVASAPLLGFIVAPLIGIAADRYGRRKVLLPCLILFGSAAIVIAVAPTFEILLAARVAQGTGGAGLINLVVVMLSDHWEGAERTKLIGRNSAVLTVCLALVPAFSGVLADATSWRWSMAFAGLALPVAFAGYKVLPAVEYRSTQTIREQFQGAGRAIRQPLNLAIMASSTLLFAVIFGVFLTALPVHLEAEFGYGASTRGFVLASPAIGATIAAFNLGRIRSMFSIRRALVLGGSGVCLGAVGVGLAPSILLLLAASIVYGLGEGMTIPTLQDATASAAPEGQRASMVAGFTSAARLGQTIGPLGMSALFVATSTTTAMVVGASVFAVVTLGFAFGPIDEEAIKRSAASK